MYKKKKDNKNEKLIYLRKRYNSQVYFYYN